MTDGTGSSHLVVVGSSAGGIEALSLLVGGLPEDFGAPLVIAQHLDPARASHLQEILARRTMLPVVTIEDRADLTPGSIYVVPANRHVEVTDHEVRLRTRDVDGSSPSVDRLLTTAAGVFRDQLIAVILTGTGSDGADGARRVKEAGGTVLIQDPDEARFPSMPESLEPTVVDLAVKVEALGPLLHDLVRGAYRPSGTDENRALERLLADVRERTGIDFAKYKRATVARRLQHRMAIVRKTKLSDYARYIAKHPEEYQRLVATFLIKVTDFFRDPDLFDYLRDTVLPELIDHARESRELRIWCAGAATGEEAYSLAILVADLLGDDLDAWTVRIFATDLDPEALAYARRARYRRSIVEQLPADLVERHFERLDGQYEARKHLRAITVFGEHDLALRAPFPRIDLVLCRNVLIYFTPELQSRALRLFAFSVRPGGYLALGKAESVDPLPEFFEMSEQRLRVSRRRATPAPPAPAHVRLPTIPRARSSTSTGLPGRVEVIPGLRLDDTAALEALPFGLVTVDHGYTIRGINRAARRLLGIHSAAVGQDLLHLVERLPAGELRELLDAALRGRAERRVLPLVGLRPPDETISAVEVAADPMVDASTRRAVLTLRDAVDVSSTGSPQHPAPGSLEARLEESEAVTRKLLRENEELTALTVEMRTASEEMLVGQEEAQAATEEVETLNEELQATNEELETLNEELQSTIEELNTTSEDMQARSIELQTMASHLEEQRRVTETERLRFELLVESLGDAVALIDRTGATVIRNEAYIQLMEQDVFEPVDDDGGAIGGRTLRQRVAAGERFDVQFAARVHDGPRRWFEAYGIPVPPEMGTGGGILVVHDTTDLSLRRLQEEFVAIVAHELRTPLTALRGYLGLLRRSSGNGASHGDDPRLLVLAEDQAERLGRLVDELFDVTRADTGRLIVNPEPVSLRAVVDSTVEIAQSLTSQRIAVEGVDESLVEIDGPRIQQVLLNLLTNAQRHAASSPSVDIRAHRQRRWLIIEVEDHGPGMRDEIREALFSRFHVDPSSPARGLGLGLYIARQIVNAHGGSIVCDSAPGEGTTFTIRLPLAASPNATRAAVPPASAVAVTADG